MHPLGTAPFGDSPAVSYVELHCHSAYSFLDGASRPEELAAMAAELGYEALALTDHDGVSGSLEFAHAAKLFGVRAITGAELTLEGGAHVTLLVETARGYANLCRLLTAAHAGTRPDREWRTATNCVLDRVPRPDPAVAPARHPARAHRGACLPVRLCAPRARRAQPERGRPALRRRSAARASSSSSSARTNEATRAATPACATSPRRSACARSPPATCTPTTRRASRSRTCLWLSATTPRSRAASPSGAATTRPSCARPPRWPSASRTIATPSRARSSSPQRLTFDLTEELGYRYPDFSDGDVPADVRLARICNHAFDERYSGLNGHKQRARERLDEELALIREIGLSGFFLLHHEVLELARDVAREVRGTDSPRSVLPPGRGRGSSVGSIVCYLTGLSHVDPVASGLSLGRFLNREIASVPDIDLDFPRDIRERLIVRVIERYGSEHTALVCSFATYRARGAIRDVGKALGLPYAELERLARYSDGWDARRVAEEVAQLPDAKRKVLSPRWRAFGELCREIAGLPRHLSQHPGGMVISSRPLVDLVPVQPAAMAGRQICQWDKDSCADAGFLKIDLLGLGMLSAVEDCVEQIARLRDEPIDLSRIPLDDQEVYDEIRQADTVGVFQIESRAQMQMLLRTRPENLDDLTIEVALVRPGPIQGGAVHPYIAHREALRRDPYVRAAGRPPVARRAAPRHARRRRLPGPGALGRDGARRLHRRRGRGAPPRDEPQALGRGARGAARALRRGRARATASTRRPPTASTTSSPPSPGSGSRSRTRSRSRCSPTSPPGCAATTRPSSCAR